MAARSKAGVTITHTHTVTVCEALATRNKEKGRHMQRLPPVTFSAPLIIGSTDATEPGPLADAVLGLARFAPGRHTSI